MWKGGGANPQPCILNPEPQSPYPRPQASTPKRLTLNSKLQDGDAEAEAEGAGDKAKETRLDPSLLLAGDERGGLQVWGFRVY